MILGNFLATFVISVARVFYVVFFLFFYSYDEMDSSLFAFEIYTYGTLKYFFHRKHVFIEPFFSVISLCSRFRMFTSYLKPLLQKYLNFKQIYLRHEIEIRIAFIPSSNKIYLQDKKKNEMYLKKIHVLIQVLNRYKTHISLNSEEKN